MALFLPGKTRCAVCDEAVHSDQEPVMFPQGLFDTRSPLAGFDDAVAHYRCLSTTETGRRAVHELREFLDDRVAYVRSRNKL
ncbi:hypothetical protein KUA19_32440 [Catellatospora sp. NEAU-YM18]|nr:hypothetical protein [Catellatospora tritici]